MPTWPSLQPEAAWTRLEAPREAERQFCLCEVGCSVITLAPEPASPASAVRVLQDHRPGEARGPGRQPPPRVLLGASTSHRAAAGAGLSASEETRRLCSPKHPAHPVMHFASGTAEPGASEGVGGCSHGTCLRADEAAVTGN